MQVVEISCCTKQYDFRLIGIQLQTLGRAPRSDVGNAVAQCQCNVLRAANRAVTDGLYIVSVLVMQLAAQREDFDDVLRARNTLVDD
jgi:hypothetical protein